MYNTRKSLQLATPPCGIITTVHSDNYQVEVETLRKIFLSEEILPWLLYLRPAFWLRGSRVQTVSFASESQEFFMPGGAYFVCSMFPGVREQRNHTLNYESDCVHIGIGIKIFMNRGRFFERSFR
jgi:hypothetical protein